MPANTLPQKQVSQTSRRAAIFDLLLVLVPIVSAILWKTYSSETMESPNVTVHVSDSKANVAPAAGSFVAEASKRAISERGRFVIALSGGSLPKLLAAGLVGDESVEWSKWHVFFADERIVPLDDKDSNYLGCDDVLFSKVPIPRNQIYPLDPTLGPVDCAKSYEGMLTNLFGIGEDIVFDLIMLGMGPDGHTASLFPGHQLLEENNLWVASIVDSPKPPPKRITLTLRTISHAHQVAFVAAGAGKTETLVEVLMAASVVIPHENKSCLYKRESDGVLLPSSIVQKVSKETHWFVDKDAANNLLQKCASAKY